MNTVETNATFPEILFLAGSAFTFPLTLCGDLALPRTSGLVLGLRALQAVIIPLLREYIEIEKTEWARWDSR